MKKALILFLALGLVAAGAFADDGKVAFSVSGSASVSWGIDLNDSIHGWKNDASSSISITFVDEASKEKGGEGVYGYIKAENFKATAFALTAPSITAKIVADLFYIKFAGKPEDGAGYASALGNATDVNPGIGTTFDSIDIPGDGDPVGGGGITVGLNSGEVNVFCLSADGWQAAVQGNYTTGIFGKVAFSPITFEYDVVMDFSPAMTIGFGVKPSVSLADVVNGLDLFVAFDGKYTNAFVYDLAAGATLNFSAANGGGDKSNFALGFYMNETEQAVKVSVTELSGDDGVLADIGATLGFTYNIDDGEWALTQTADYTTDDFKVYESFGIDSANVMPLTLSVDLKTVIKNITIGLKYASANLNGGTDVGTITAKVSISL